MPTTEIADPGDAYLLRVEYEKDRVRFSIAELGCDDIAWVYLSKSKVRFLHGELGKFLARANYKYICGKIDR